MKVVLACPAPPRSRKGNRVTAVRWSRMLRALGHRVQIVKEYAGEPCDVLVALHARRSYPSIARYRQVRPQGALVVALTGTDLYRDLRTSARARRSLTLADRIVVLQPQALAALPASVRSRTRVILQSATPVRGSNAKRRGHFQVCVLGHLRAEKDPFRAVRALRLLPDDLPIRVVHAGEALRASLARIAREQMAREPRYRWVGELPRGRARRLLARSHLLVLSSRLEGGANVLSEAIVEGVPAVASRIDGSIGLLGGDYPGFFAVGDTRALADLLQRAATDPAFYDELTRWCRRLAPRFTPPREQAAWNDIVLELAQLSPRQRHAPQDKALERSAQA